MPYFFFVQGELIKVRIWHDNKFPKASWYLERINIEDETTKKFYEFPCDRWLGKDKDDGSLVRELACANRDEATDSPVAGKTFSTNWKSCLPCVKYFVFFYSI